MNGTDHLALFVKSYQETKANSRRMVEVLIKDQEDNILSSLRENITFADRDLQDYSALLLALEKAKDLGANNITLFIDNATICSQLTDAGLCSDEIVQGFYEEATELIDFFDNVTIKTTQLDPEFKEFYA